MILYQRKRFCFLQFKLICIAQYFAKKNLCSASNCSTDLSVFLLMLCTNYGQRVKNTDAKSAPEGVASITVSSGLECYTEKSRKIRRLCSLPTDYCKVDLEVYTAF